MRRQVDNTMAKQHFNSNHKNIITDGFMYKFEFIT